MAPESKEKERFVVESAYGTVFATMQYTLTDVPGQFQPEFLLQNKLTHQ
jgi:hypothetical protein